MGGGPAGLAAGYYAKKSGIPFTIFEAAAAVGGNCRTIGHKGSYFDTGAHRFHDKNKEVTGEIKRLLGDSLKKIFVPSRIYSEGKFIDFPLTPFDLLKKIGIAEFSLSALDVIGSRVLLKNKGDDFKSYAHKAYGKKIAQRFLIEYSEKLWGLPAEQLSPGISGKRLKGLDLRTFVLEALAGAKAKTRHIDGEFYYPQKGIGQIFNKVTEFCGEESIHLHSRITRVFHDGERVTSIEINNDRRHEVSFLVNTLPLPLLARIMEPVLPMSILQSLSTLKFRNVLLVCLLIDKPSISNDATIYFPSSKFIFTRVYEPRNRSAFMSPAGKTSLVAEIPCFSGDDNWNADESTIVKKVISQLISTGLINEREITGHYVHRIMNAYPVLEKNVQEKLAPAQEYFTRFENMHHSGRSGLFAYTHIHDMFTEGKRIVQSYPHCPVSNSSQPGIELVA